MYAHECMRLTKIRSIFISWRELHTCIWKKDYGYLVFEWLLYYTEHKSVIFFFFVSKSLLFLLSTYFFPHWPYSTPLVVRFEFLWFAFAPSFIVGMILDFKRIPSAEILFKEDIYCLMTTVSIFLF